MCNSYTTQLFAFPLNSRSKHTRVFVPLQSTNRSLSVSHIELSVWVAKVQGSILSGSEPASQSFTASNWYGFFCGHELLLGMVPTNSNATVKLRFQLFFSGPVIPREEIKSMWTWSISLSDQRILKYWMYYRQEVCFNTSCNKIQKKENFYAMKKFL